MPKSLWQLTNSKKNTIKKITSKIVHGLIKVNHFTFDNFNGFVLSQSLQL